jgi:hypothetical protein
MTRWEYAEIEVAIGGPIPGPRFTGTVFDGNGDHQEIEINDNPARAIAAMGLDGWEMVSVYARVEVGLSNAHRVSYVFKRPLSG